ncbi:MAG: lamin tail domain-containing protein [Flavobacteriales bacterium]|nr:lamin tail domain-containing protein [Flavobacteriales bacterium]
MRMTFLFFIIFSLPYLISAQFTDNFSDGDFTNNPTWFGDSNKFEVDSSGRLHTIYDSVTSEIYLSTISKVSENAVWEFSSEYFFNPSSSNFAKIYLMSDNEDLTSDLNGYFVKVGGESGSIDDVDLYMQIGSTEILLIDGIDGVASSNPNLSIKVTKDNLGNWELFTDTSSSNCLSNCLSNGTANDLTLNSSDFFGVVCKYTKTRSDKFYFDDFSVSGSWDTTSPQKILPNDLVINELFIDPNPSIGLPEYEYIELYNRTNSDINLTDFIIKIGSTEKVFPVSQIKADSFTVLIKEDIIDSFPSNISKIGFTSISLTNSAADVLILDNYGTIIHSVSYTDKWYNDDNKIDGGWSLEQVSQDLYCEGENNWRASVSAIGGTPGKQNSVYGQNVYSGNLRINNIYTEDLNTVSIVFNKKMDSTLVSNTSIYEIDKGISTPQSAVYNSENPNKVRLTFSNSLQSGIIYNLSVNNQISDCAGTLLDTSLHYKISLADSCLSSEIIINEILFDPKNDGVDYVEIYNNSDKSFDLKNYRISNYLIDWNTPENWKIITEESKFIFPDEYWVITTDSAKVKDQYFSENPYNYIEVSSLPTFSNDEGTVAIIHQSLLNTIDVLQYNSDMHHPLLSEVDGVSLERISPDLKEWQSSSSVSGYGTPTYQNSQYYQAYSFGEVSLFPEIFSPNNDGFEDVLTINWNFDRSDLMGIISIFNSDGILLKVIVNNELLGSSGTKIWNGTDDNYSLLPQGIYIVLIDVLSDNGYINQYKKVVVLQN